MRRLLWRGGSDQGFSLVEVLAAMSVFGIITLGTVPLVLTSLKGAALSRSYTVGKNLAVQAMERARGLPYYVDFPTQKAYASDTGAPRKVDLLDMYYPSYDASGVFTTTCTDSVADRQRPECPKEVPPNYTVVFKARFVSAVASGSSETYQTKVAPGSYAWNPSTYSGQDRPPTQLVELTVTASWQMRDATRSFSLKGLIGDRPYGKVTVDGAANLNYLVRATTVLVDASGGRRRVVGTAGMSESGVQTKTISSADQTVRAAQLQLFDVPSDPSLQGTLLEEQAGASAGYHAAPDVVSTSLSASARTLTDSSLGTVGGMDETSITGGKYVRVDGEPPPGPRRAEIPDAFGRAGDAVACRAGGEQPVATGYLCRSPVLQGPSGQDADRGYVVGSQGRDRSRQGRVLTSERLLRQAATPSYRLHLGPHSRGFGRLHYGACGGRSGRLLLRRSVQGNSRDVRGERGGGRRDVVGEALLLRRR